MRQNETSTYRLENYHGFLKLIYFHRQHIPQKHRKSMKFSLIAMSWLPTQASTYKLQPIFGSAVSLTKPR
jgi:hypothetical protein